MKKFNGKVIDINATAMKLGDRSLNLLAMHALSGCDTVSYPFGKGKVSALNVVLDRDIGLQVFADPSAHEKEWMKAGMDFLSILYSGHLAESLNDLRFKLFSKRKEPPKIKTLPPTTKAAIEHVKRARLQVLTWRAADQIDPPSADISAFGWKMEGGIHVPVRGAVVAPKELLQLVACGCKTCSRSNCSCRSAGVSCTPYCKCEATDCANVYTQKDDDVSTDTDGEQEV